MPLGFQITEADTGKPVFQHKYNAKDRLVVIDMPVPTMGDTIAWFTYCETFRQRHGCKLAVCMPDHTRALFEPVYPDIRFISREEKKSLSPYAHYRLGVFLNDETGICAPVDYHFCPLHHYAGYFLGIDPFAHDEPPKISFDPDKREIAEPYVVIATQASGMCKRWIYPNGWYKVVKFLKENGYRVIDIDGAPVQGGGIHWNYIPANAEDFTGPKPLSERAELISHADFFVGLPSGLSWIAWCCHKPVVLISGFSGDNAEFYTRYRVINRNVCHGCYSDPRCIFENHKQDWCPRHCGTDRHYECQHGITPGMVEAIIRCVPEFQEHIKDRKDKGL